MKSADLQEATRVVVRRAQRCGFVLPSEIREEMNRLGIPENRWKEVVGQSGGTLRYRQGRYYYKAAVSASLQAAQRQQRAIERAVRGLIRQHKKMSAKTDRRKHDRLSFVHPVQVRSEDGRTRTLLSRDLSANGIRLIGCGSLLGQRVYVLIPHPAPDRPLCLLVRILWTCAVGDGLFENGGTFLELLDGPPETLTNSARPVADEEE